MTAKPSTLPEWASSLVHVIQPSATKKADGHLTGEQPVPDYVNWVLNTNYQWAQFVNAVFTASGTATGDIALSGGATFGGNLVVGGTITGGHPVRTVAIPSSAVGLDTNSTSFTRGAGSITWLGGANAVAAAPLANGERIQAVRAYVADVASSTIAVALVSTGHTGTTTPICSATSSGAGGNQTLTLTGTFPTTVAGALTLQFTTTGTGTLTVYNVEIDYDMA